MKNKFEGRDKYSELGLVSRQIETILDAKSKEIGRVWTQPAELGNIANVWDEFNKETQELILCAIPEVAPYLLRKRLSNLDKVAK